MSRLLKVEYHLVDHCNLNCVWCEHFSSISKEYYVTLEDVANDFRRLARIKGVNENKVNIYLLGGEPLLHPQVIQIMESVRSIFPNRDNVDIRLVTNGILLNRMPQLFWDSCANNRITLSVTKYPINVDYAAIEGLAKKNGVQFEIFHVKITDSMRTVPIDASGRSSNQNSFENCPIAHRCCYLKGDKIYSCPRIPNINSYNQHYGFDLQVTKHDYIELLDTLSIDDVFSFLDTPNEFCKYCDMEKMSSTPWSTHKKSRNEWAV